MTKKFFILLKNQWIFINKYGIMKEMVKIRRKATRPIKDFLLGKDWFQKGAREDIRIIKKILQENEIPFLLVFGTCLGVIREGDFIEYDYDIDIAITEKTLPEIKDQVVEGLRQEGFKIPEYQSYQSCTTIKCIRKVEASVTWVQQEGDYFVWRDAKRSGEVEVQVPASLLENSRKVQLAGETFFVPDPPEVYLEKVYGDWRVPKKRAVTNLVVEK